MRDEDEYFNYLNKILYPTHLTIINKKSIVPMDKVITLSFSSPKFKLLHDLLWYKMGYDPDSPLTEKESLAIANIVGVLIFRCSCDEDRIIKMIMRLHKASLAKLMEASVENQILEIPSLAITTIATLVECRFVPRHDMFSLSILPGE